MAFSNRLFSPLRYPGGKARLAPFVTEILRTNHLDGGHYVEPFAGGAGVALDLLFGSVASEIHINDVDPAVFSFWDAAVNHSDDLLDLLRSSKVTIDSWHYWKAVAADLPNYSIPERGFSTLFLNRTNRSGILAAGPIGGKAQGGTYRLDARFDQATLDARLKRIAEHRSQIHPTCVDAGELLLSLPLALGGAKQFWYLDPPYYVKGQGLYRNAYEHGDHEDLAEKIQGSELIRSWMVSYDDARPIAQMYRGRQVLRYGLSYSAHRQYQGREIIAFSDDLRVFGRKCLPGASSRPRRMASIRSG